MHNLFIRCLLVSTVITVPLLCQNTPTVTVQQPSYSVTTGGSITLVCTVSSSLAITNVQWQRNINGAITTITSNTNTNKYSGSTTTTPSLTIFNAAQSDAGTYTCSASNSVGTGTSTNTTLSVTGNTPNVTVQQPSYYVTTGQSITLVCTVSSSLAITNVQWQRYINGAITTITSNTNTNKYSGSTTTTPSLTIFNAGQNDAGTYICSASNSVGTGFSTTTTLSVTGNIPFVTVQQPSYSVTTGQSITLVCTVLSSLAITNVLWQRNINGVITTITSNTNTNKYSGSTTTTPSLTIFNAVQSDAGTYTCSASNVVGTGFSTTTTLSVTGIEEAVVITGLTVNGTLHEDSVVTFVCIAYVTRYIGNIMAFWKLNNAIINPTSTSRWQLDIIQLDPQDPGIRQYHLKVNPLVTEDTGTVTCQINYGTKQTIKHKDITVIGKPTVSVSPMTSTAYQGDALRITCTVINSYSTNTSIVWYKNGVIVQSKAGRGDDNSNTLSDVMIVSNIQGNLNVECAAFNIAGEGARISSVVRVIEPQACYKFCPTDHDAFNTIWIGTVAPTNVEIPCKEQYTGSMTRNCNTDGIWEEPNYSSCVRKDLDVLRKQSDYLKHGVEVGDVNNILNELTKVTAEENDNLTSGDLDASSSILINLADHASDSPDSIDIDQLEIFVSSCNNILQNRNRPSWEQLTILGYSGVTRVVESVTTYTKAYADWNDIDVKRVVEKDNIVVQVGRTFSKNITLPDRNLTQSSWLSETASQITLQKVDIKDNVTLKYSSAFYRNISDLFHHYVLPSGSSEAVNSSYDVNSIIVEFSIIPKPKTLHSPLVVEFSHLSANYSNQICVFWNFSIPNTPNGAWSTIGSRLVRSNDVSTVCAFDHTTNFAVLMSPGRTPVSHVLALSIISAVGCGISLLFLVVTLVVYGILWKYLNSDRGKNDKVVDRAIILVNLCTALIVSYVLFLAGIKQTGNKTTCTAIAVMLHYIFLVDFSLMLAEGVEIAFSVMQVFSTKSRIRWMMPLCWFAPVIVVITSASSTRLDGYGTPNFCWLSFDSGLLWAFAVPALFIILINFVILVLIIRTSLRTHLMKEKTAAEKTKAEISNICVLLPLFGLTWVFGILSVNDESVVFQYFFALLNSLQGFFIFVFHCFLDKRIRKGIEHMSRKRKSQQLDSSTFFQRLKASKNDTSTSNHLSTKSSSLPNHDSTIDESINYKGVTKKESKDNHESMKEENKDNNESNKEKSKDNLDSTKKESKNNLDSTKKESKDNLDSTKKESKDVHQSTKNDNRSHDETEVNENHHVSTEEVNNDHQEPIDVETYHNALGVNSLGSSKETDKMRKYKTKSDSMTSQEDRRLSTESKEFQTSDLRGGDMKNHHIDSKKDVNFMNINEDATSEPQQEKRNQHLSSKSSKKITGKSKKSKSQRPSKESRMETKTRTQSVRHPYTDPYGNYPIHRGYHGGMWGFNPNLPNEYQQIGPRPSRSLYMPPNSENRRPRYGNNQPEFKWTEA